MYLRTRQGRVLAAVAAEQHNNPMQFDLQALRQPPGVLSQRQHLGSVLPLFVEPVAAYVLYVCWNTTQSLMGRRDQARLAAAEAKLRKMVADLKVLLVYSCSFHTFWRQACILNSALSASLQDTTRYQKTQALLSKYDPDYVPLSPSPPQNQGVQSPGGSTPFRSLRSADSRGGIKAMPCRPVGLLA